MSINAVKIYASLMCCNMLHLYNEVISLERAKCDGFHIDIMDGSFVNNFAMNFYEIETIKQITSLPLDLHLMISTPSKFLERLIALQPSCITYHFETKENINDLVKETKNAGIDVGIALNPETKLHCLNNEIFSGIDKIVVMAVPPGFAGGQFLTATYRRVRLIRKHLVEAGFTNLPIAVDGGVSTKNIAKLHANGATIFVGGSSGLFIKNADYHQQIQLLKRRTHVNGSS